MFDFSYFIVFWWQSDVLILIHSIQQRCEFFSVNVGQSLCVTAASVCVRIYFFCKRVLIVNNWATGTGSSAWLSSPKKKTYKNSSFVLTCEELNKHFLTWHYLWEPNTYCKFIQTSFICFVDIVAFFLPLEGDSDTIGSCLRSWNIMYRTQCTNALVLLVYDAHVPRSHLRDQHLLNFLWGTSILDHMNKKAQRQLQAETVSQDFDFIES